MNVNFDSGFSGSQALDLLGDLKLREQRTALPAGLQEV